ncbi:uncharacterized protein LOC128237773 [Mya arenaria]|uniref:uncharacterized protein LOC128237773 n=1 Tax=Mya arenaria TaxID=6604 RepID=UPI0022E7B24B|nr:uncharacterized protein LOC128237773 [Mya arenaria]
MDMFQTFCQNRAVVFRVVLLLQCTRVFALVHQVSYTCHKPINDADEFILELRLKPSGDTAVTGLQSAVKYYYVLTTPNCSATLTDGTYVLSKSINVEDSDCGVTKVDSTASIYSLLFKALGTIQYYEVKCDTTKLLGSVASTSQFKTTEGVEARTQMSSTLGAQRIVMRSRMAHTVMDPRDGIYISCLRHYQNGLYT